MAAIAPLRPNETPPGPPPRVPAAEPPSTRWLVAGVAGLTLLAGALGMLRLGAKPLWYDEAFSVLFAQTDWAYFWELSWAKELNALVYYLLLRGWMGLLGLSEASLRGLSVLCATATVPVVAGLARRLFGDRAALVAAALLATHGGLLQYAQETRTYALATMLVSVAAWCFVVAVQDRSLRAWLGFALFAGVAVYAHLFAVLATVALVASLVVVPPRQLRWGQVVVALGVYGLLVAPSVLFLTQAQTEQFDWVAAQLDGVFSRSLFFLAGNATTLVENLTVAVLAVLVLSWARRAARHGRTTEAWARVLVASWAVVPLLLAFAVSQVRPMLVPRYLIVAVPGVVLVVTAVLTLIWGRRTLLAVTAAAVALQLVALPSQLYAKPKVNEDWRALAETVVERAGPRDGLIVVPAWQRVPLEYYLAVHPATRRDPADLPAPLSPPEPWGTKHPYGGFGTVVDDDTAAGSRRVWLVLDGDRTRPELAAQQAALRGWELVEETDFGELALRRYERA